MSCEPSSAAIAAAIADCRADRPGGFDRLVELLYPELKRIASRQLGRLRPGETIDTTSLVHEVYVKMAGKARFEDRVHFLAASATAMRHVLVNAAHRKLTAKRGAGRRPETLGEEADGDSRHRIEEVLAVGHALERLQEMDPRMCAVVECRFFAGMTEEETALALSTSERTVRRDWQRARGWLRRTLAERDADS